MINKIWPDKAVYFGRCFYLTQVFTHPSNVQQMEHLMISVSFEFLHLTLINLSKTPEAKVDQVTDWVFMVENEHGYKHYHNCSLQLFIIYLSFRLDFTIIEAGLILIQNISITMLTYFRHSYPECWSNDIVLQFTFAST